MFFPSIFDDRAASLGGTTTFGTDSERHHPINEGADVRLQRVDVLGKHRLLDRRDQARVGQVDAVDLDPGRLLVEEVAGSFLVNLRIGLSGSKKPQPRRMRPYQPSML